MLEEYGNALRWGLFCPEYDELVWWEKILYHIPYFRRTRFKCIRIPRPMPEEWDSWIAILKHDAVRVLPPNSVYELREMIPVDFGQKGGMAWYHTPDMNSRTVQPELGWSFGYKLLSIEKTPC